MFGKIIDYSINKNKINFTFENRKTSIEVITPSIINVFAGLKRDEHFSRAIDGEKAVNCNFEVLKEKEYVLIKTDELIVKVRDHFKVDFYDKNNNPLCEEYEGERKLMDKKGIWDVAVLEGHDVKGGQGNSKIQVLKKMDGNEYFYGLGEKTGPLNKRDYKYTMWNTDNPDPHVESFESLYQSTPFFITLKDEKAFGIFFDNTHKTHFDMGKENQNYYMFTAEDGNLDYYFIGGPEVKSVVKGYTYLTGTTPMPQMWTLGYQQCRWSYEDKDRIYELVNNFREKQIPCDVIYLDIDYMDGYRVFTVNDKTFPDFKEMLDDLKSKGIKIVTIIDPGVKKDKGYSIYDEGIENNYFATDKDGVPYVNEVWPGDSLYPDFSDESVRNWWSKNQKILLDQGVAGIWNDMNEPASFNGPLPDDVQFKNDGHPTDHTEVHNVYGHLMAKSCFEGIKEETQKRPFVITRAAYAGSQKYSTVWTGDNQSLWEHLRMSLPMLMNIGLSGMAFAGTDVGGFGFDATKELLSRWVQVGCFTPLFRNHSASLTRDQEPWTFDQRTEDINRKYIELRYKILPYLYDLMWEAENTGLSVIRPLLLHYQNDEETYEINDQIMVGENIMVAPIVEQGKKARSIYLPEGVWYDYWTKEKIEGKKYITRKAPLDVCPIYIKEGSIIPNYELQQYVGEKNIDTLILDVYPGNGKCTHYEDDKESYNYRNGEFNLYEYKLNYNNEKIELNINKSNSGYNSNYENYLVRLNGVDVKEVIVNGKTIELVKEENSVNFKVDISTTKIEIVTN